MWGKLEPSTDSLAMLGVFGSWSTVPIITCSILLGSIAVFLNDSFSEVITKLPRKSPFPNTKGNISPSVKY